MAWQTILLLNYSVEMSVPAELRDLKKLNEMADELSHSSNKRPGALWVDKYSPRRYTELLSDEVKY